MEKFENGEDDTKHPDYGTITETDSIKEDPEPTKFVDMLKVWPKSTFLIIVCEFCERFSYYCMRSVLTLYFMNILKFSGDTATVLYHAFNVLCYASPMLGSFIADGYIGKYWTIFSISIFYMIGQFTLAAASTFSVDASVHPWLDLLGLFVIGMSTGGIKPCVSALGGDQFKPHYTLMISLYFSIFYFTINAGSTISSFVSPIMRSKPCLGHDSCYPLSFGIPAVLMIIAIAIFMAGSPFYKKLKPKENTIARVAGTIKKAVGNKLKRGSPKRTHWLDHFLDNHKCADDLKCIEAKGKCAQKRFVKDVKELVRVAVIMLPVPFFWTLYDQQGSRWVIQAVAMDSKIGDSFSLLPDQMSTLNALLIMIFIPIFQGFIYPSVEKLGIRLTPLRKMVAGGFLAVLSFVICGFLQLAVNQTLPDIPSSSTAFVSVVNAYPTGTCDFEISGIPGYESKFISANSSFIDNKIDDIKQLYRLSVGKGGRSYQIVFTPNKNSSACDSTSFTVSAHFIGGKSYMVTLLPMGRTFVREAQWEKPTEGQGQFAIGLTVVLPCNRFKLNGTSCTNGSFNGSFALCRYDKECDPQKHDWYYAWKSSDNKKFKYLDVSNQNGASLQGFSLDYIDVKPGTFRLYLVNYMKDYKGDHSPKKSEIQVEPFDVYLQVKRMGGVYAWTVADDQNGNIISTLHTIVPENHMNILWQVPQYFVITAAEILFSITGLEFAYSQLAPSLKALVSAMWLLTQAVGDAIIIIMDELDLFDNLATENFTYAGIMFVVVFILMLLSIFYYEYKEIKPNGEDDDEEIEESNGERNGFSMTLQNGGFHDDELLTKL